MTKPVFTKTLRGEERTSGLAAMIGWAHLAQLLEQNGPVHKDEQVVQFEVTEHGLKYFIEHKQLTK